MTDDKIYSLLNDLDTDIDSYDKEALSEFETKKYCRSVLAATRPKRKGRMAVSAACIALLVLTCTLVGFRQEVYAQLQEISYNIAGFLGIREDLAPYTTVVHQSVSKGDSTITLNEVILDRDELVVSVSQSFSQAMEPEAIPPLSCQVTINGRIIAEGGSGGSRLTDSTHVEQVINCDVPDLNLQDNLDIQLDISYLSEGESPVYTFAFSAAGRQLAADTQSIPLDEHFTLPDKTAVTLTEYMDNSLGQKIYFTCSQNLKYDLLLKGQDNLGNPVSFYLSRVRKNNGRLNIDLLDSSLSENASSLSLTPWAVKFPESSGKMSNDYQPVGEPFTISILN